MTDDIGGSGGGPTDFSRRRLLAGLGGLGAIGAASGAGTFAYLSDEETLPNNEIGAGEVDLDVSCLGDGGCTVSNGTVSFTPDDQIRRGDFGDVTFDVAVRSNPARLWFGTTCPPSHDDLGDALDVSLRVGSEWVFSSGSLSELRREFVDGLRIDDLDGEACLDPDGDALTIELSWELPDDAPADAAGETTDFEFQLYTEQCRHVSEDDAAGSNPFAGLGPCDEPRDECPDCVEGGKADDIDGDIVLSDSGDMSTWLSIDEGPLAGDAYLFVTDVEYKDDEDEAVGVRFELVDENGDPAGQLCEVRIKGGNDTGTYPIEPPSNDTEEVLYSPESSGQGGLAGISHIQIDVCADEDGGDDDDEDDHDDSDDCVACPDEDLKLLTLTFRYLGEESAHVIATPDQGNASSGRFVDRTIQPDERFTLDGNDLDRNGKAEDWIGPNVEIAIEDGPVTEIHTSCSESLEVGDTFGSDGSGDPLYELVGGTSTAGERLCGSEDLQ
ncbi:SipW-dependent-type signal peptide-containing protein [Halorubrum sp. F4]|uniref:SipW-dependent-type signal peptide-containing protein n=1 Tax=Halorubrum sp. F4 TaxID=2989715 RepID=UPI00248129D5|nr:SipW-dependent-type signal peptide-containing protein [Halorubrum sp. F4]